MRLLVLTAAAAQAAVPQQRAGAGKGFLFSPQMLGDAPWSSSHASGSKETRGHHIQRRGTLRIADCRHVAASAAACVPLFLHPGKRCCKRPSKTSVQTFLSLIFFFNIFYLSPRLLLLWVRLGWRLAFLKKKEGVERARSEKVSALCSLDWPASLLIISSFLKNRSPSVSFWLLQICVRMPIKPGKTTKLKRSADPMMGIGERGAK